jgi:hypothetical protein
MIHSRQKSARVSYIETILLMVRLID